MQITGTADEIAEFIKLIKNENIGDHEISVDINGEVTYRYFKSKTNK